MPSDANVDPLDDQRLDRRQALVGVLQVSCGLLIGGAATATPLLERDRTPTITPTATDRAATAMIDTGHPRIAALAEELGRGAGSPEEVAIRTHDWVRDRIAFGIAPAFYDMRASEVLEAGVGYCNTKTTLFSALLRASGIATRTRMYDLSSQVLRGLFDPGTPSVDHAVTEVWLGGRWVGVDSYVVDRPLVDSARALLTREGRIGGYGIHRDGRSAWDARSDARIQCVIDPPTPAWVLADHGVFTDVADFYARHADARNRLNPLSRVFIRLGARGIERDIERVRRAG